MDQESKTLLKVAKSFKELQSALIQCLDFYRFQRLLEVLYIGPSR